MLSIHSPKTTQALKDFELSNKFENADISDENQVTSLSNYNVWSLPLDVAFVLQCHLPVIQNTFRIVSGS